MSQNSSIEWTDATWNPVSGCSKVSAGCKNCYAEKVAERFWGERKFTDVRCHPERLDQPLHWRKPRKIFVNSMSDLFHESVPETFIRDVFDTMTKAGEHDFQVLTKRPKRMREFIENHAGNSSWFPLKEPKNIWLGVSCENQETADERIPLLLRTLAAVRFISAEPLLGPVKIPNGLDWVICGGESGHGARPMHPDWARGLRDQCQAAGVPFFFKQWGEFFPQNNSPEPGEYKRWGKKLSGRLLDGREWNEFPQK